MSLLTNYEGLRHQIERLVRENEELKKLVRLIRENHELKSAIKTQAGGLGISGLSSGLGEGATGPAPHQGNCVFLPTSPAAANQPGLQDMGMVALAPMADMLGTPQPGTTVASIVSPLTGQLNALLSGSMPISQSNQLSSILAGPVAVPPVGTLTSSLGLPSTGPLTPMSPVAVPPVGTLTSSLGLPSTGPLTPSSPMAVPPAGTLTSSFGLTSTGPLAPSNPLFAPTTAPTNVPQNLLASPMGNLVLSETTRVRLLESTRQCPSGPQESAGSGPPAHTRAVTSTDRPRTSQDMEALSVTFVGQPIQTSTPNSPTTAFSYGGVFDHRTQPTAPQGQAVPVSVQASSSACSIAPGPTAPTPAPQAAATNCASSSGTHMAQGATHSPTRSHHSPTRSSITSHSQSRTSCPPASVNDARGSRATETTRKSILELERKLAHRKASKFPESPRESKLLAWERLVGEIAFQLDRRILSSIFPERVRLYGFTVSNIPEKIIQASMNPNDNKLDEDMCQTLTQRYVSIMNRLQSLGYNGRVHPAMTEQLVNAYGILRERPELAASEGGSYTVDFLQRVLVDTVHPTMLTDALLLLSCLSQLAHDDGKPMFIW
ncbi:PREDICTED: speriolin [Chrysochloris asiatica]|uniref:Speriolin n=1 Tax=Chrysochloris asiatica TaxID=185453 RepID=A0A9B0SXP4_CHRAS|nr:PREDICTED: speriolin [Chrysochloris asiatica]